MANVMSKLENKIFKKLTAGQMIGGGINAYFLYDTYKNSRQEGNGTVMAATKTIGEQLVIDAVGLKGYLGYQALTGLPKLGVKGFEALSKQARTLASYNNNANIPFYNATFVDNQQAYTMRQAGMQLAQASKYNLQQSMLGDEARYMHV